MNECNYRTCRCKRIYMRADGDVTTYKAYKTVKWCSDTLEPQPTPCCSANAWLIIPPPLTRTHKELLAAHARMIYKISKVNKTRTNTKLSIKSNNPAHRSATVVRVLGWRLAAASQVEAR